MTGACFFIGHREAPQELLPLLRAEIETHIREYGVWEFIVGHYGGFDHMAAEAVIAAKKLHPHISLFLLLPYHPATHPVETPTGFDGSYYPWGGKGVPNRIAILRANRYMVEHVDFLIAYARFPGSNARKLVEYARQREKKGFLQVHNLAEKEGEAPQKNHSRFPARDRV